MASFGGVASNPRLLAGRFVWTAAHIAEPAELLYRTKAHNRCARFSRLVIYCEPMREMTPKEYARERRLHFQTVYKMLRKGEIPNAERIGKLWRIWWEKPKGPTK